MRGKEAQLHIDKFHCCCEGVRPKAGVVCLPRKETNIDNVGCGVLVEKVAQNIKDPASVHIFQWVMRVFNVLLHACIMPSAGS